MHPPAYLPRLTTRLAEGLARLPAERRARHASYLTSLQGPDGTFPDREGGSDLYYTGFALRGLAVLGALTPEICQRTAGYLRSRLTGQATVVDFFSFLYSVLLVQTGGGPDVLAEAPTDWPDRVQAVLEGFRTADGGYTKAGGGASGSTYHSFLVALCYELLARPIPDLPGLARFVLSRRRDDGGFVEIGPMKRSGTNPTAAAAGLMRVLQPHHDVLTPDVREGVVEFLVESVSDEGGLRANTRVPLADILSTFTGVWTLDELGAMDRLNLQDVRDYAAGVERAEGGFHGGLWDGGHDAEYTFYGLGVLSLVG